MKKSARFEEGASWWVVVGYADNDIDVVGCSTYSQARGVFESALEQFRSGGVLSAEMFDSEGRCVASHEYSPFSMDAPRRSGLYRAVHDASDTTYEYLRFGGISGRLASGA
jgi:hypothetical protein